MSPKKTPPREWEPLAEWFERWWEPHEFFATVRAHSKAIPSFNLLTRPQLRRLLEGYAAGLFAMIRAQHEASISLRLQRDRFPAFDLRIRDDILPFEVVEADEPERRRGDEYRETARREAEGLAPALEEFDPVANEQAALPAIANAIQKKADKCYEPAPFLLVCVNFVIVD